MGTVKRIERFPAGTVAAPPSKSYGHRALICAALAALAPTGGQSMIENLGSSEDIAATTRCLQGLGARVEKGEGGTLVARAAETQAAEPEGLPVLDCGESGSTLRFLLPVAALAGKEYAFKGHGRLPGRPMQVYEQVFEKAKVAFCQKGDTFYIKGPLRGGVYSLPGNVSSQFISGLLLALPLAKEDSEIRLESPLESAAYVEMTLEVMRHFGVEVKATEAGYRVQGGQCYRPATYRVQADYSQAAFFLAAAALGRDVQVSGLEGTLQGDAKIINILLKMGCNVVVEKGVARVLPQPLQPVLVDATDIPDLVPVVAALCCFCSGKSEIFGAGRLRLKESDRLAAMAQELNRLGARVTERAEGLTIEGGAPLKGGPADAHGDHRIAMALAVAAIGCENTVELSGWESVTKSYPHFWQDFEREAKHG